MTKEQLHEGLCNDLHNLYVRKNKDYGDSFSKVYDQLGIVSAVTQIAHKYNRLVNLVGNKDTPNYESIEDTLMDLAGYCLLTLCEIEYDDVKDINKEEDSIDSSNCC